jgi:hypothetical protein
LAAAVAGAAVAAEAELPLLQEQCRYVTPELPLRQAKNMYVTAGSQELKEYHDAML